ncbi:HAMP domain-containing protein [Skermania sp. ID1734]|uniref:sensor histidine kinase n=1 Tax=Skermania sp. ID1734 TaxID=2597516 RepID=UPI001180177B|nr:histidine kinase [Skermania sp. ID1734]TSE01933.1 HAMP domain-containing protein [Skermania sp. ID1734]
MAVHRSPARALFRRLIAINGLVFAVGTLALAVSPATVSSPILLTEIPVLIIGLAVILTANGLLLRASLSPLDSLATLMERVDPLRRGDRLTVAGNGDLSELIASFNSMLDRLESERAAASAYALTAQEGERQRIARELHDEVGQSLTVALLTMKRAVDRSPPAARDDLRSAQETVRASLDEVRGIAQRLRPDVLDDLGLESALNALCSDFARASGVAVDRNIDPGLPRLGSDAELVCYRIAQEGLTNIARHADATTVGFSLSASQDRILLRIKDNGRGGADEEGAGIRGMRERALLVGGALRISSPPRAGTEIRLAIPAVTELK